MTTDNTDSNIDERAPSPRTIRAVAAHFERRAYAQSRAIAATGDHDHSHHDALTRMRVATETLRDEAQRLERGDAPVVPKHTFSLGTQPSWPPGQWPWQITYGNGAGGDNV